jgi:hypothetical protein
MEELFSTFIQFNNVIQDLINQLYELIPILDEEESAISQYLFMETEKSIIRKNNQMKKIQYTEEKRISLTKKICYLIGYDIRNQKISLPLIKNIFETYIDNVKNLLEKDVVEKLNTTRNNFLEIFNELNSAYECSSNRIRRNQIILKKVLQNVNSSINLFQMAGEPGLNYDSSGKTNTPSNSSNSSSSIRVVV